jgi:hypothetical protein
MLLLLRIVSANGLSFTIANNFITVTHKRSREKFSRLLCITYFFFGNHFISGTIAGSLK